ncbi:URC4/urg3 family protein, partial [Acinetobacter baumannii]|nr:URC4/urg3 family protein [Acinetobacter baumannii]
HPASPDGLVPFHKLTQWLTYSLLEPLEDGGLTVTGLDALTGLPEYRNGGLLYDFELMVPRDAGFAEAVHRVDEPAIVEWRALTVTGLDLVADATRQALGLSADAFPLARVL